MRTYHVTRIDHNVTGARPVKVSEAGMTADQATDLAGAMRADRPIGSSIDYRTAADSKLTR